MTNKLSTSMWVAKKWLVLKCKCIICGNKHVGVAETIALKLTGTTEDFKLPIIICNYCKHDDVEYTIEKVNDTDPNK